MGSKGSSSPSTSVIQTANPSVPNSGLLNSLGQGAATKDATYTSSPWRAMDYMAGYTAPQSDIPQFNPSTSGNLGQAVGNSTPQMQQQAQMAYGGIPQGMGGPQSFWTGQGPLQGLPQTSSSTGATMPTPSPQALQGMAQNISPSLAGLGQILMGILGGGQQNSGGMPPPQQNQPLTTQQAPISQTQAAPPPANPGATYNTVKPS